jgi:integrase
VSIEKVTRRSGAVVWRVRWREGGRNRARTFDRKGDATRFETDVRRRQQTGDLPRVEGGRETLSVFAETWWSTYALPNLAPKTLTIYAGLWDRHVLARLGEIALRDLTPELVASFRADLTAAGVGDATVRKTLAFLQGVLQRAVEWRRIDSNPAKAVRKPPQRKTRVVDLPSPAAVEDMRSSMRSRKRLRDATLISVLAYAGLRPGEALALEWRHVRERTILVEQAVAFGEVKVTKTGQTRTVRLLPPLAADLAEWRLASRRPGPKALVFPGPGGNVWTDTSYRNWRRRVFVPAASAAGLDASRPYFLRHLFCSLLLAEGASVVEVARQAGHSPAMTLSTYGHVIEELEGEERRSAEVVIRAARDARQAGRTTLAGPTRTGR